MRKAFFHLLLLLPLLVPMLAAAQAISIQRINPTNWWVGMKRPNVQVLVYGPGAGTLAYTIAYPGVKLVKTSTVENPNYAFLDLTIAATAKPGKVQIVGKKGALTLTQAWELRARDNSPKGQGVTQADFIYLAVPDRLPTATRPMTSLPTCATPAPTEPTPSCATAATWPGQASTWATSKTWASRPCGSRRSSKTTSR